MKTVKKPFVPLSPGFLNSRVLLRVADMSFILLPWFPTAGGGKKGTTERSDV